MISPLYSSLGNRVRSCLKKLKQTNPQNIHCEKKMAVVSGKRRTCALTETTACHIKGGLHYLRHVVKTGSNMMGALFKKIPCGRVEGIEVAKPKASITFGPQIPQRQLSTLRFGWAQGGPRGQKLGQWEYSQRGGCSFKMLVQISEGS